MPSWEANAAAMLDAAFSSFPDETGGAEVPEVAVVDGPKGSTSRPETRAGQRHGLSRELRHRLLPVVADGVPVAV